MPRYIFLTLLSLIMVGCSSGGNETPAPQNSAQNATAPTVVARPPALPGQCATTPTLAQPEGAFYRADAPGRISLIEDGMTGTGLVLRGTITTINCEPLIGAKVDIWQANGNGVYDETGTRLHGWVVTGAAGDYRVETIVPGSANGLAPQIHVKVSSAAGTVLLTTNVYIPSAAAPLDANVRSQLTAREVPPDNQGRRVTIFDIVVP